MQPKKNEIKLLKDQNRIEVSGGLMGEGGRRQLHPHSLTNDGVNTKKRREGFWGLLADHLRVENDTLRCAFTTLAGISC